jgi:hypothetical protein
MENRQFAAAGVYKYLQPVLCEEETVMPLDGVHQDELCGYMPLTGVDGMGAIVAPSVPGSTTSSLSDGHDDGEDTRDNNVGATTRGDSVQSDGPW